MILLYQYPPVWGLPSGSPFTLKVETYLRLADLRYQVVPIADPRRAPKGKLPYIEDDGRQIADSGFIIEHLEATRGAPVDGGLSDEDRARGHAIRRMIEESLYFVTLYARWVEDAGWAVIRPVFFAGLPKPLQMVLPTMVRRQVRRDLHGQGYGRHTAEEVYRIGAADLAALATLLGDRPWLLGDTPRTVDASAFGMLAQLLLAPVDHPLKTAAAAHPTLEAYCRRMLGRCFPELVERLH